VGIVNHQIPLSSGEWNLGQLSNRTPCVIEKNEVDRDARYGKSLEKVSKPGYRTSREVWPSIHQNTGGAACGGQSSVYRNEAWRDVHWGHLWEGKAGRAMGVLLHFEVPNKELLTIGPISYSKSLLLIQHN
jgi:hypothetical protein